ncbi:ribonuclease T2 [Rhizobium sp. RU20A]|uniref:ribonuclease T2 family protein n=1 Tax=Rhizobium sp. RU20A TaxID=1907412 RepID=UPI0009564AB1|nr:ribonuclease [Rhizobium sp. RU20A]SIQ21989.1 ribonuclease T2 [Rhizobium sp. RU20A]
MKRMPFPAAMAACVLLILSLAPGTTRAAEPEPPVKTALILSVSWQPGFCETRRSRTECRSEQAESFEATHFTLHGLWPMRQSYCGVDEATKALDKTGKWTDLAPLTLTAANAATLDARMPGRRSGLDRHQWVRSGSCTGLTPDDYFALQDTFLEKLNASPVLALFRSRSGQIVTAAEVRSAFDQGFGPGAGQRLRLTCRKAGDRQLVTGLTIGLGALAQPAAATPLADLVLKAAATSEKCTQAIVDAAGLQAPATR